MIIKVKCLPSLWIFITSYGLLHMQIGNCIFMSNSSSKSSFIVLGKLKFGAGNLGFKKYKFWSLVN